MASERATMASSINKKEYLHWYQRKYSRRSLLQQSKSSSFSQPGQRHFSLFQSTPPIQDPFPTSGSEHSSNVDLQPTPSGPIADPMYITRAAARGAWRKQETCSLAERNAPFNLSQMGPRPARPGCQSCCRKWRARGCFLFFSLLPLLRSWRPEVLYFLPRIPVNYGALLTP